MIVTGGKIYEWCAQCGRLVRLNKPILGSLHVCSNPPQDAASIAYRHAQLKQDLDAAWEAGRPQQTQVESDRRLRLLAQRNT